VHLCPQGTEIADGHGTGPVRGGGAPAKDCRGKLRSISDGILSDLEAAIEAALRNATGAGWPKSTELAKHRLLS